MTEDLTYETFSRRVGEEFTVRLERIGPLVLASLSAPPEGSGRPFSLVFRGSKDAPLEQRTCAMEHPEVGEFDIFLVPVGPDASGPLYEAVFN